MKTNKLSLTLAFVVLCFSATKLFAQTDFKPIFSKVRLEARADFDYFSQYNVVDGMAETPWNPYGFHGRYFNLVMGGQINDKFSYYFRQRIVAKNGTVSLYDNTDFLYVNYQATKNWQVRLGKDALAVGGFEYDASPIDVLFSTEYWDNFYCFQLGASVGYKSNDGNHLLMAQVANSPYVHFGATNLGSEEAWKSGLLSYNLYWNGNFGHLKVLHSVSLFERPDHGYLGYIALGHKLVYDNWDIYVDLMHHSLGAEDWGNNFAVVSCANFDIAKGFSAFVKGAYEQNKSDEALPSYNAALGCYDILVEAGHSYATYGLGVEYTPESCSDVKLHCFVADKMAMYEADNKSVETHAWQLNLGVTWYMDINKMARNAKSK